MGFFSVEDDTAHGVPSRSLGHEMGGVDVEGVIEVRVRHALLHTDECGEMDNGVGLRRGDHLGERSRRGDVALVKGEVRGGEGRREVGAAAGAEIIKTGDGVAGGQQTVHRVAANEAGGAGDENMCHRAETFSKNAGVNSGRRAGVIGSELSTKFP